MRKIQKLGIAVIVVLASFVGIVNFMSQSAEGTNVSGLISSDTTWNMSGSPYVITGNTTVQNGVTLTINPGVEVRFDGFHALYIDGGLMAKGTPTNKIIMTSNKPSPAPMDWLSITINSTGDAEIEHTEISYAYAAIMLEFSGNINISNNVLTENTIGIYGDTYDSRISYNAISNNVAQGMILYSLTGGNNNNTISSNNISQNPGGGIEFFNAFNCIIENNEIISGYNGITLSSSSENTIANNTISNNENGLLGMWTWNNTIMNNNIIGNAAGLNLSSLALNNTIFNNHIINNIVQAIDDSHSNFWNVTYSESPLRGGNYWSDYSPTCLDTFNGSVTPQTTGSPDGICDNPNVIDADSIDYYPLTSVPDTEPPAIANLQPADLSTTSEDKPIIGANYSDHSGIDTSTLVLKVDGIDVTSALGTVITPTGVSYTPDTALSDGLHSAFLEVSDIIGNTETVSWSFTVGTTSDITPPTITDMEPANVSTINVSIPVISANYSDDAGINVSSVLLKVDDQDVTASATVTQDGVIYIPSSGLSEGVHTVYVEVRDSNGNLANKSWSFTVNTLRHSPTQSDFLSDYWWVLLVIVFIVVAILAIIILWRWKNGGKKEEIDEGS